jgi:class 3 adenylate cyclase
MEHQFPFTGQPRVEAFGQRHRTGLVTLLFTDIVGSTALKQQLGDRAAADWFRKHDELIREMLAQFPAGEEIETAGDSFFLLFATPSDAVKFAMLVQSRGLSQEGRTAAFDRIGIHVGEVVLGHESDPKSREVFGIQIDLCSRVMSLAKAGQVLMTRAVFDSARQVLKGEDIHGIGGLEWLNYGAYLLKGLEEPVEVCEVREAGQGTAGPPPAPKRPCGRSALAKSLSWGGALELVSWFRIRAGCWKRSWVKAGLVRSGSAGTARRRSSGFLSSVFRRSECAFLSVS